MAHHLVYRITNKIDGKFYIGCHVTENLDDGYMGSGKLLSRAIAKHGLQNFVREILFDLPSKEQMFQKEKELVVLSPKCYNLKEGGDGGWDFCNSQKSAEERKALASHAGKACMRKFPKWSHLSDDAKRRRVLGRPPTLGMTGKKHSAETKRRMGEAISRKSRGEMNSQFGSRWITDGTVNKKISKSDQIPDGWRAGRVL